MNLKELAREKGTNVKRLAEKCGVTPSTLYAISSGETNADNIGIDLFLKISGALGMSAEELRRVLDGTVVPPVEHGRPDVLAVDEQELLANYRRMSADDKSTMLEMARSLALLGDVKREDARGAASGYERVVSTA